MDKRKLKKKTLSVISKLYVILIFLFFYAPVVVMVVFSFNDSRANVVWQGFTTKWYTKLFQDTELWTVFGKTLFIAVVTTLLGVVVGTMGAVGFMNAKFKGKKLITNSIYFPIVIPEIVLAIATLLVFTQGGIDLSMGTIIIGNTTLVLPYVYITIKARLVGMDPSIEEASLDLGANRFYTFMHVTLPAIVPGVMSGAFMAFSLALDDLIITSPCKCRDSNIANESIFDDQERCITGDQCINNDYLWCQHGCYACLSDQRTGQDDNNTPKKSPFRLRFKQRFRPSCRYDRLHSQYGQLCEINKSYTHMQNINIIDKKQRRKLVRSDLRLY